MIKLPWKRGLGRSSPRLWSTLDSWSPDGQADPRGDLPLRASDVEEMIQMRPEEKNWIKESWQSGDINLEANQYLIGTPFLRSFRPQM